MGSGTSKQRAEVKLELEKVKKEVARKKETIAALRHQVVEVRVCMLPLTVLSTTRACHEPCAGKHPCDRTLGITTAPNAQLHIKACV